jgi:thiol-disulfide isomerase/thioredoxin
MVPFRRGISLAAALALAAILSCSGGEKQEGETAGNEERGTVSETAEGVNTYKGSVADVTLRTLDGTEKKISDFGDMILFVNYLASWNEDSKKLVPIMNEVQRKFFKNVVVIGIVDDAKNASQARAFKSNNDVKFELFLPAGPTGKFGKTRRYPTSHVVTREDYLLTTFEGLFRDTKYEDMILAMYRRRM